MHALLDGVTAAVVGLVGATVVHLIPAAFGDVAAVAIFALALAVLYRCQASLYRCQASIGVAVVILGAGLLGLVFL